MLLKYSLKWFNLLLQIFGQFSGLLEILFLSCFNLWKLYGVMHPLIIIIIKTIIVILSDLP